MKNTTTKTNTGIMKLTDIEIKAAAGGFGEDYPDCPVKEGEKYRGKCLHGDMVAVSKVSLNSNATDFEHKYIIDYFYLDYLEHNKFRANIGVFLDHYTKA